MFIELIDLLRCINPHEDIPLVASFQNVSNRFVQDATLGCPVCAARYTIKGGVADFSGGEASPQCEDERAAASHRREELATRVGAFLDASEPGATLVLGGVWAYAAEELSEMADARVLAINPGNAVRESARVGLLTVSRAIPAAPGSCRGVAVDAWFNAAIIESAVRVTQPGGRIVGPTVMPAPEDLTVLAHDEQYWVGHKAPAVVAIRRAQAR